MFQKNFRDVVSACDYLFVCYADSCHDAPWAGPEVGVAIGRLGVPGVNI